MAEATEGQNMSGDIAIDVLDSAFVDSIRQELLEATISLRSNEQPTIYRVPEPIRSITPKYYEPRLVSIGPYHRNKQSLQPMEEHKWRYLQAILSRNPAVNVKYLLEKIKALEPQARRSYSERIELDSNEFLKMMLLDGCFIVGLFAKYWREDGPDDPIFGNGSLLKTVCEDMFLLENQLPYCILQCIFRCVFPDEDADVKLVEEVVGFYNSLSWVPRSGQRRKMESYHHLLHLIHCHLLPSPQKPVILLRHPTIPSAEKLQESGIKFKRNVRKDSALDVEFNNGVMEIPYLFIDNFTVRLFRNLVAFEQCYPSAGSYFTAYTIFMDAIIDTKADVEILRDKKILEHAFDSDEELARLVNGLAEGNLFVNDNYLSFQLLKFREDFESKWRRWRASYWETKWLRWRAGLMRDYFGNPWSIIALIGAIVVVILTAIQSFFSVYAYVRPPH